MFAYFSKAEDETSGTIKQAAKEEFDRNMTKFTASQ